MREGRQPYWHQDRGEDGRSEEHVREPVWDLEAMAGWGGIASVRDALPDAWKIGTGIKRNGPETWRIHRIRAAKRAFLSSPPSPRSCAGVWTLPTIRCAKRTLHVTRKSEASQRKTRRASHLCGSHSVHPVYVSQIMAELVSVDTSKHVGLLALATTPGTDITCTSDRASTRVMTPRIDHRIARPATDRGARKLPSTSAMAPSNMLRSDSRHWAVTV